MDPIEKFKHERVARIAEFGCDKRLLELSDQWLELSMRRKYVYNFEWMGRPIIQYPQDIMAIQELIWQIRPDLVIETGIAHGGSIVLTASMLAMLDMCDAIEQGRVMDPRNSCRKVIGLDIDIRDHNRAAIQAHPMASRISMLQGSSVNPSVVEQVHQMAARYKRVMVFLDSMHTHDHVLGELEAYGNLVTPGSYCVVFDTFVENVSKNLFLDRPWGPGNNPLTAVREYLKTHPEFEIDKSIQHKLQITVATDGYLKRVP
jgi:cephalosporin hydroxylase